MPLFGPPDVDKLKAKGDVKGLINALGYRKDQQSDYKAAAVRRAAAGALGKIGDPRAVEPLIAALSDPNLDVRPAAVKALGTIGDPRAVEPLVAALSGPHTSWSVRMAAVETLGTIGDPRAVEPLVAALGDQDEFVRRDAAEVLGQIGDAGAVEPLIAALSDQNECVRKAAAEALDRLAWKPGRGVAGATYWVAKREWDKCVQIGAPAVELLIAALKDEDKDVRFAAARALGEIGDARAVGPLVAALTDQDKNVREDAAEALGKIGDARAVEPLIDVFRMAEDWPVCKAAAGALVQIGAPAVEPLSAALKGFLHYPWVRKAAVEALDRLAWNPDSGAAGAAYWVVKGDWGKCIEIGAPAVEPLIAALKDQDVRKVAAEALGRIGDARAVEPLVGALTDRSADVRKAAAEALGKIGDARAVEPLVAALKDAAHRPDRIGDYWDALCKAAAEALGQIGAPAAEALVAALRGTRDSKLLRVAHPVLVDIGAPAVEPLIVALTDGFGVVRIAAAEALVAIYQAGKLEEAQKARLLAQRPAVTQAHVDYWFGDQPSCQGGRGHADEGIGVAFPV